MKQFILQVPTHENYSPDNRELSAIRNLAWLLCKINAEPEEIKAIEEDGVECYLDGRNTTGLLNFEKAHNSFIKVYLRGRFHYANIIIVEV